MRADPRLLACLLILSMPMAGASTSQPDEPTTRLQSHARQWQAMTPAQQQALRQRIARWDALPPAIRRQRRESWAAWQALPPDQQLRIRAAAIDLAALPLARQQTLRAQFAGLDASEQHGWLLGPALGEHFPALQPLLLQVPDGERQPLLAILRSLSSEQLTDLGVLAQRTPPTQRDALRRSLLSTAPGDRELWLRAQLAR